MNELALVLVLASLHVGYTTPEQGINPGLGVAAPLSSHVTVEAGLYRNSQNGLSLYNTMRVHTKGPVNVGLHVGFVTGYDWPVLPLVFPSLEIGTSRMRLRLDVLPVRHPIVGIQILVGR